MTILLSLTTISLELPLAILLSALALILARIVPVRFLELAVVTLRFTLERVPVFTFGIVRTAGIALGFFKGWEVTSVSDCIE
jgi:hypothetical protein